MKPYICAYVDIEIKGEVCASVIFWVSSIWHCNKHREGTGLTGTLFSIADNTNLQLLLAWVQQSVKRPLCSEPLINQDL